MSIPARVIAAGTVGGHPVGQYLLSGELNFTEAAREPSP